VILYSLGNFTFGSYSDMATRSVVARLVLAHGRVQELRLTPINVRNADVVFQPRPLAPEEAERVVAELAELSAALGTRLASERGAAVWRPEVAAR
jgi:poly-gamma-glutamate synthesis protein (capsule biosynthesis protein)